jgi:hypothetical protein
VIAKVVVVPGIGGRSLYIEVDEAEVSVARTGGPRDLPEGAEAVGMRDRVVDTLQALQDNITTLAVAVHDSLKDNPPEEWALELNIGFKGNLTPIPVILNGEAQGGIKVTAKWKKFSSSS